MTEIALPIFPVIGAIMLPIMPAEVKRWLHVTRRVPKDQ
jgi:hypothetical protein